MEHIQNPDLEITANSNRIRKYTLVNKNGMKTEIINFGGIITSLTAPDKNGKYQDVALGFADPEDYIDGNPYFFGAIIGRFGNRIANAEFNLEDQSYQLNKNDGENSLHSGKDGFHTKFWNIEPVQNTEFPTLKLTNTSPDGEEGFPGKLSVTVFYTLTDDDALEISYEAETDKPTIVNLTQHSYFNLSGNFTEPITSHELQINADRFLPINPSLIPTGEQKPVKDSPFDFTVSKLIGKDIDADDEQLSLCKGYDHNWIPNGKGFRKIATAFHKESGRMMDVFTDQPGVQFYSGNFLEGKYGNRTGLCLETQHFPDSPNQPSFPSTELKPGEKYQTKTIYKFSVKNE